MVLAVAFFMAVTVAIAPLVSVEVLGGAMPPIARPFAGMGIFTVVPVICPVAIVDVAMEVLRAAKPWTGTDKDAVGKPLGSVIAVGSATIRRGIVIAIGTSGGYTDANTDLGLRSGSTCCNA